MLEKLNINYIIYM